jgi:hypothetical protein
MLGDSAVPTSDRCALAASAIASIIDPGAKLTLLLRPGDHARR